MDSDDGRAAQAQVAGEQQAQGDEAAAQQAQATDSAGGTGGNDADKARAEYEAALAKCDKRIAALEGEIAEALCREMDELRRKGDEERIGFELQIAGARNVKAARALFADYDNDIDKLRAGEPWLFGADAPAPPQTGATGLPNAGAATDEGATMRRWRGIAGLPEDKE